jgi:hypothetical protein
MNSTFYSTDVLRAKMSRDYGWRASCPAGGVTVVVVGSMLLIGI